MKTGLFVFLTTIIGGCAAAPVEAQSERSARESSDPGGSGVDVDPSAVQLDDQTVFFDGDRLTVCETPGNEGFTNQLVAIDSGMDAVIHGKVPHVVVTTPDGYWVSRDYEWAEHNVYELACGTGAWKLSGGTDSINHIRNLDLSGAFGIGGESFACDGGFTLSDVQLNVKSLFVKDGKLSVPDVSLDFTGDTTAGAGFGCEWKLSKDAIAFPGGIPVLYSLDFKVRISISADRTARLHGHVGSDGANIDGGESSFTLTPQVQVGVTFYKVLGAYVGVKVPITLTPNPPCRPSFHVEADPFVGAQLGFGTGGGVEVTHGVGVETNLATLWSHDFVDQCQ